jgi:hypothetical protein
MIGYLLGDLFPYIAGAAVALLGILGSYMAGKRQGRLRAKSEALEADRKADRRMDDADVSHGDADADTAWLRDRAGK